MQEPSVLFTSAYFGVAGGYVKQESMLSTAIGIGQAVALYQCFRALRDAGSTS